ncbi:3-deoxy-D-manno-octulosonic acid transferase [Paracoccus sp. Z330]|uniref:3-deoxy-D-manno-octulosonic acid transferase n=1 Tax=Paracoccus onchidii TaxID=3017813 RepID=A0ABT4ZIX7_9RHOB|nr:glycosyltransferase N-terminal domain-containing protein [Paracoccus onchidii]MDB6179321.1 3-deoxy-D-manno-octulosonic acid transferase [Paracoccus onchidii]
MIYSFSSRLAETGLQIRARLGGSAALRQRLGIGVSPERGEIWVHGASVGELTSARPVIEALAAAFTVVITANSETGRELAAGWGLPAYLAPLDTPAATRRFLDAVQPHLQITLEGEFWPLRSRMLAQRGIPQAMIGARMSERSAKSWARLPGLIRPVLERLTLVSAQDPYSESRLLALGLPPRALCPRLDLKLLTPAAIFPPQASEDRGNVILAASTHEGEEDLILDAWLAARSAFPDLRLILAIRHPQRGDDVAELIRSRGLELHRRSDGATRGTILLADTIGEMDRWYRRAGICVVGGSLADHGGHTPWEPAAYRCAILHGGHISNFIDAYGALQEAGAARHVTAGTLAATLVELSQNPGVARDMGGRARQVLVDRAGDPDALVARLRDLAVKRD